MMSMFLMFAAGIAERSLTVVGIPSSNMSMLELPLMEMMSLDIVTEDNSRFEDVHDIMNDIEIGIKKTNGKYIKIDDRSSAIKYVIDNAMEGDIILLLGKGHETYKDKNGIKTHYDEREVIKEIIG